MLQRRQRAHIVVDLGVDHHRTGFQQQPARAEQRADGDAVVDRAVSGSPTSYVVEASSAPSGPANLANFSTGNALTTLVVPEVPAGVYNVRIRAVDASGTSAPSYEVS